jgi:hypothetical protein
MVDPNSQSLNRFTENASKVEALNNEIAIILQGTTIDRKSLITCGVDVCQVDETTTAVRLGCVDGSSQRTGAKQRRPSAGAKRTAKPKKTLPKPLPVSPGLMSRYDGKDLYEKVWSAPMGTVAKEFGVSDVALAKTCRKLHIPVPGRGYWAKKAANQPVASRPPLPKVQVR